MKTLKFECGAVMPSSCKIGDWPPLDSKPRKKDGRVALVVYDSDSETITRPVMDRGSPAPCRFSCPKKRASGRREDRCFHEDDWIQKHPEHKDEPFYRSARVVITCYPYLEERE